MNVPRIFVQIAAYRDPELQYTVRDLFQKAAQPSRVTVGICAQYDFIADGHCFALPYPFPAQVREKRMHFSESEGVCWARAETQKLWCGEEYTLQIDSHMRFEPGWDEALLTMLSECPSAKPVLSTYPSGYTPPDTCVSGFAPVLTAKEFGSEQILRHRALSISEKDVPQKPVLGAFLGAGYFFASSAVIAEAPYDPMVYFYGEESSLCVRLWTRGWDMYSPYKNVVYHKYNRENRTTHFADHKEWSARDKRSIARVKHLLGTERSEDPAVLQDIDKYGLGSVRSLEAYQEFSGVDFKNQTLAEKALKPFLYTS